MITGIYGDIKIMDKMKIQKTILCISALMNVVFLAFVWFKFSQLVSQLPPDKGVQSLIPIITGLKVLIILTASLIGISLWAKKKAAVVVILVISILFNTFLFLVLSGAIPGPKLCGPEIVSPSIHPVLIPGMTGFQFDSSSPDTVITCTQSIFSLRAWQDGKTQLEWGKYKF
jgi:hypothetical protein